MFLLQAARNEASALGAVTAWYRDVQRKHAAAGLGTDPIIASILPGSSRKLSQHEGPNDRAPSSQASVSECDTVRLRLHGHSSVTAASTNP